MLWLQAFDNQPGVSLPLHVLDYERVEAWLGAALDLDPGSHYPLLVATRLYGSVADRGRVRRMLEFAYDRFLQAPNHRWRWLAHASILAKHRLGDLPLALRYARAITTHATGPQVPYWARDLTVIVLAEMGEYEAARGLVAALLAGGRYATRTSFVSWRRSWRRSMHLARRLGPHQIPLLPGIDHRGG